MININKHKTFFYINKEVMNELYDSTLITLGAVGVGMLTRKLFNDGLSTAANLVPTLKLASAVGLSTLGFKYAQDKKWIPTDPFKQKC